MGGIQRHISPLGARVGAGRGEVSAMGAWLGGVQGGGVTGEREDDIGMWGLSSDIMSN